MYGVLIHNGVHLLSETPISDSYAIAGLYGTDNRFEYLPEKRQLVTDVETYMLDILEERAPA